MSTSNIDFSTNIDFVNKYNINNPLILSEIKNQLSGDQLLNISNLLPGNDNPNSKLDNLLKYTNIKRACCLNKQGTDVTNPNTGILVKIPIPQNFSGLTSTTGKLYNYVEMKIEIPSEFCDQIFKLTNDLDFKNSKNNVCDVFMKTYCDNIKQEFKNLNNGIFDYAQWPQYKQECSCYADSPYDNSKLQSTGNVVIAPKCIFPGCTIGSNNVYIDPVSRDPQNQCNLTVCNSLFDVSGVSAGNNANLNSSIIQKCGSQLPSSDAQKLNDKLAKLSAQQSNPSPPSNSPTNPPSNPQTNPQSNPPTIPPTIPQTNPQSNPQSNPKSNPPTIQSPSNSGNSQMNSISEKIANMSKTDKMIIIGIIMLLVFWILVKLFLLMIR